MAERLPSEILPNYLASKRITEGLTFSKIVDDLSLSDRKRVSPSSKGTSPILQGNEAQTALVLFSQLKYEI